MNSTFYLSLSLQNIEETHKMRIFNINFQMCNHELFSDTQEKYENKQRQGITEESLIKD